MKKRRKEEKKRQGRERGRRKRQAGGGQRGLGGRQGWEGGCTDVAPRLLCYCGPSAFTLMREEALEGFEKRCDVMGLPSNWSLAAALRTDCRRAKAKASSFHISNKIKVRQKKTNIMIPLICGI